MEYAGATQTQRGTYSSLSDEPKNKNCCNGPIIPDRDMLSTLIQMELVSQLYTVSSITLSNIKLQGTQRYSNEIMNHVMFTEKLKRLLN